jgi:hypothetical protein
MLTRAGKICDWIEAMCRVPEGRHVGEHMVLLDRDPEISGPCEWSPA